LILCPEKLLVVKNIHKRFGGVVALEDVSFDVEKGEILGVIGPNGAGKTTLLNILSGFLKPDSGQIFYKGRNITNLAPHKRVKIGIVRTFQIPRPIPDFTVLDYLVTSSLSVAGKISEKILNDLGLSNVSYLKTGELTVIEKKRLELARALTLNPELLLVDEVMAGSRPHEIEHFVNLLKSQREKGVTIIFIEHIMQAVSLLADRVIVLDQGRKIAEGIPHRVLSDISVIKAYLGE